MRSKDLQSKDLRSKDLPLDLRKSFGSYKILWILEKLCVGKLPFLNGFNNRSTFPYNWFHLFDSSCLIHWSFIRLLIRSFKFYRILYISIVYRREMVGKLLLSIVLISLLRVSMHILKKACTKNRYIRYSYRNIRDSVFGICHLGFEKCLYCLNE